MHDSVPKIPEAIFRRYPIEHASTASQLDLSGFVNLSADMQSIKISSKVDEDSWNELKALASESHRNLSGVPTEAIREYAARKRVRLVVPDHLDQSIADNAALGRLLAK